MNFMLRGWLVHSELDRYIPKHIILCLFNSRIYFLGPYLLKGERGCGSTEKDKADEFL